PFEYQKSVHSLLHLRPWWLSLEGVLSPPRCACAAPPPAQRRAAGSTRSREHPRGSQPLGRAVWATLAHHEAEKLAMHFALHFSARSIVAEKRRDPRKAFAFADPWSAKYQGTSRSMRRTCHLALRWPPCALAARFPLQAAQAEHLQSTPVRAPGLGRPVHSPVSVLKSQ